MQPAGGELVVDKVGVETGGIDQKPGMNREAAIGIQTKVGIRCGLRIAGILAARGLKAKRGSLALDKEEGGGNMVFILAAL